ncbi:MAG: extracellular solute-binding protein, partial [Anaerolineae bacterium]
MTAKRSMSRREFLEMAGASSIAVFVAACAQPTPTPTQAPPATAAQATAAPTQPPATSVPAESPAASYNVAEFAKGFEPAPESAHGYDDMSKKYTIKWMRGSWYMVGTFPDIDPIKKYIDKVMNVDFQLICSTTDVFEQINLMVASGEGAPDVWWELSNMEQARKLADDGIAIPDLMPYVQQYCPNYLKLLDVTGGRESNLRATTVAGKTVAFARPNFTGEPGDAIFVRRDWVDALGLKMPETTDDLFELAKALKEKGKDLGCKHGITPGWIFDWNPLGGFNALAQPFGCPSVPFLENDTLSWGRALPSRKDFLAYIKQFIDAGLVAQDWYLWEYPEGATNMNSCNWGIFTGGAWGAMTIGGPSWSCFPELEFIKWIEGPAGHRWGSKGQSTAIASEQLSTALLKDEGKLKRCLHIMDEWSNPYSSLSKAAAHRPYKMDPPFENADCIVREFIENGPFVEVRDWSQVDKTAVDAETGERCPWLLEDKGLGEWRPMSVASYSKMFYCWP